MNLQRLKEKLNQLLPYWKLEVNIITIFLLLTTFSFVLIITYTYQKNKEVTFDFSDSLIQQLSQEASGKLNNLLIDIENFSDIEKTMVTKIEDISLENTTLIHYMFNALKKIPNLTVLHMASTNGTWIGLFTLLPNTPYQKNPNQYLPSNYKYALQYVNRNTEIPKEEWIYMDADNKILETEVIQPVDYDPRVRPWFQKALEVKKPYWTPIFMFVITHDPGFTYAYPIFNDKHEIIAVGGGDVELRFISNFMQTHKIQNNDQSMLLTKDGKVLASSEPLSDVKITNIRDFPLFNQAYQIFLKEGKSSFLFDDNHIEYVASFTPFISETKEDWYISVIIPSKTLLAKILEIQKNLYIIFFIIIIFTLFLILIFSKRISKPIVALSKEVNRLRKLDLTGTISQSPHIKEIHQMTESVISLKSALQSFSSYVPKELVRKLLNEGKAISLGGSRKKLVILFSDIADFTSISENTSTEEIMRQLEEYFDKLSTIILENNGTIDKYIGDSIMAFWGAPKDLDNPSLLAAESALLCQQALSELNQKWQDEGKKPFYTRIGIHSGNVIVGNIGTVERMNYTVVGDSVNLASRLEGINKNYKTKIIVSEILARDIEHEFLLRPLDTVNVKGKQEKVKIFELVAKLHSPTITQEQIQLSSSFKQAFEAYENNRTKEALLLFQKIHEQYPEDYPTKLYIERLST